MMKKSPTTIYKVIHVVLREPEFQCCCLPPTQAITFKPCYAIVRVTPSKALYIIDINIQSSKTVDQVGCRNSMIIILGGLSVLK